MVELADDKELVECPDCGGDGNEECPECSGSCEVSCTNCDGE